MKTYTNNKADDPSAGHAPQRVQFAPSQRLGAATDSTTQRRKASANPAAPAPVPANFDNLDVDGILSDWVGALREFAVDALVVLGPDAWNPLQERQVLALYPPRLLDAAQALAQSHDFDASWRASDAPMVAWQDISKSATSATGQWRRKWLALGYQSMVRVEFTLPAQRAFECFMFSARQFHDRNEAAALAWSAMNVWPMLRRAIAQARSPLSARECECLILAFEGLTSQQTSERLQCSNRTVIYYLTNAMHKLGVDSKLAAIQRACWLGVI